MLTYPVTPEIGDTMILAFLVTLAEQLAQVQVTFPVLAQQYQATGMPGVFRAADQHICTGDWFDARSHRSLIKLDQCK